MYPEAYVAFLHEFHTTRDYFECHEILEEYWKEDPPEQAAKNIGLASFSLPLLCIIKDGEMEKVQNGSFQIASTCWKQTGPYYRTSVWMMRRFSNF